eukprot:COSAG03_NODE_24014_length_275_cov_0.875000_1_plen_50_part_10
MRCAVAVFERLGRKGWRSDGPPEVTVLALGWRVNAGNLQGCGPPRQQDFQ